MEDSVAGGLQQFARGPPTQQIHNNWIKASVAGGPQQFARGPPTQQIHNNNVAVSADDRL